MCVVHMYRVGCVCLWCGMYVRMVGGMCVCPFQRAAFDVNRLNAMAKVSL